MGRNIAEAVLASRDRLVATARDPRRLEDLVTKYGDRTAPLDVTDEREAYAAVQAAVDAFGRLDVVVNNAGYADIAPFEQLSAERFKAVVDTNFMVSSTCVGWRSRSCESRRARILQISSVGGRLARPGNSPYHAAKWAVGGFTESLAQELAPFGVKVCALEPGGMRIARPRYSDLLPDMNRPSAQSSRLWSLTGVTRPAHKVAQVTSIGCRRSPETRRPGSRRKRWLMSTDDARGASPECDSSEMIYGLPRANAPNHALEATADRREGLT